MLKREIRPDGQALLDVIAQHGVLNNETLASIGYIAGLGVHEINRLCVVVCQLNAHLNPSDKLVLTAPGSARLGWLPTYMKASEADKMPIQA